MSQLNGSIPHLLDAFPPRIFQDEVASQDCAECAELRATLTGASWWRIPGEFIQAHASHLPLLTKDAYVAFLPAWLREALQDPQGELAQLLMQNLREAKEAPYFSRQQSYAVIQFAKWIAQHNGRDHDDTANSDVLARIEQAWGG